MCWEIPTAHSAYLWWRACAQVNAPACLPPPRPCTPQCRAPKRKKKKREQTLIRPSPKTSAWAKTQNRARAHRRRTDLRADKVNTQRSSNRLAGWEVLHNEGCRKQQFGFLVFRVLVLGLDNLPQNDLNNLKSYLVSFFIFIDLGIPFGVTPPLM